MRAARLGVTAGLPNDTGRGRPDWLPGFSELAVQVSNTAAGGILNSSGSANSFGDKRRVGCHPFTQRCAAAKFLQQTEPTQAIKLGPRMRRSVCRLPILFGAPCPVPGHSVLAADPCAKRRRVLRQATP